MAMPSVTRKFDESALRQLGIDTWLIGGHWCIGKDRDSSAKVDAIVNGLPVNFTRRHYGRGQFYCWVEVWHAGDWHSLGDPWPCHTPKGSELIKAVAEFLAREPAAALEKHA